MSKSKTEWRLTSEIPKKTNETLMANNKPSTEWRLTTPAPEQEAFYKQPIRDVGIGLAHAGRNLHNLPHDLAHGVDVAGSAIGRLFGAPELKNNNSNLASYFPNDEQNYSDVFGQKGEPTFAHKAVQKGIEFAPDIIGGINALRSVGLLPHLTRRGASKKLRQVSKLNAQGKIKPLNVNPELIEDMAQFLPKTAPYRNALEEAHYGDYQKLFNLQSDVGKESAARARDIFSSAERSHGRAGFKSVNALLDNMHKEIQAQGLVKESKLLSEGRNDYRRHKKFLPYRNALLLAGAGMAIPRNSITDFIKKILMHNNS
jgi:hypothetical protein